MSLLRHDGEHVRFPYDNFDEDKFKNEARDEWRRLVNELMQENPTLERPWQKLKRAQLLEKIQRCKWRAEGKTEYLEGFLLPALNHHPHPPPSPPSPPDSLLPPPPPPPSLCALLLTSSTGQHPLAAYVSADPRFFRRKKRGEENSDSGSEECQQ
eukprot:765749-Hanusia_phi.AAC.5